MTVDLEKEAEKRRKTLLRIFASAYREISCVCGCEQHIPLLRVIGSLAKNRGPLYATDACNKRMLRLKESEHHAER